MLLRKIYNLYFSENKKLAIELKEMLGFTPGKLYLYQLAFLHKSIKDKIKNKYTNERLEYLGDAVLSSIVGEYLFKKYPTKDEGFLTKMRSKIVKRKTLNEISNKMGVDKILGEYAIGKISNAMAGNALEALIGAIYLDIGYKRTQRFIIKKLIRNHINFDELETTDDNYKSRLLEWAQKEGKTVNFVLKDQDKVNGRDLFKIAIEVDNKAVSKSQGYNKKSAEQRASQAAIKKLKISKEK